MKLPVFKALKLFLEGYNEEVWFFHNLEKSLSFTYFYINPLNINFMGSTIL